MINNQCAHIVMKLIITNIVSVATTKAAQPIQSSLVNNNINKPINAIKKNVSVKEDLKPNTMNGR